MHTASLNLNYSEFEFKSNMVSWNQIIPSLHSCENVVASPVDSPVWQLLGKNFKYSPLRSGLALLCYSGSSATRASPGVM